MELYIAGPITGFPDHPSAFGRAKRVVAGHGHAPISPLDLYAGDDWVTGMVADIPALLNADGIVLLPGWPTSRGARLELQLALEFKKRVFILVDDDLVDVTDPKAA